MTREKPPVNRDNTSALSLIATECCPLPRKDTCIEIAKILISILMVFTTDICTYSIKTEAET